MKRNWIVGVCLLALTVALAPAAHATIYIGTLSGANESPPSGSLGTGTVIVTISADLLSMEVQTNFLGLTGTTTAAHIHCCLVPAGPLNVGVATMLPTFTGFPSGVTAGTYDQTFDLTLASTYNPAFVGAGTVDAARNALITGIATGTAYFNIHTSAFAGGEVRAFFTPLPEPQTFALAVLGMGVLLAARRRAAA